MSASAPKYLSCACVCVVAVHNTLVSLVTNASAVTGGISGSYRNRTQVLGLMPEDLPSLTVSVENQILLLLLREGNSDLSVRVGVGRLYNDDGLLVCVRWLSFARSDVYRYNTPLVSYMATKIDQMQAEQKEVSHRLSLTHTPHHVCLCSQAIFSTLSAPDLAQLKTSLTLSILTSPSSPRQSC